VAAGHSTALRPLCGSGVAGRPAGGRPL